MKFDDIYEFIGEIGVYQVCVVAAMSVICMFTADSITMIFVGGSMSHWCRVDELANLSYSQQKQVAIPTVDSSAFSSCHMYVFNYSMFTELELSTWNRTQRILNETQTADCTHWVFDQSTFSSTIVSRFELVCGYDYLNQLVSTVYMTGTVIGSITAGAVSDRFGRLSATMIYLLVHCIGIILTCFAPNYVTMAVGRFIQGTGVAACFLTAYVLAMETIGPSYRTAVGTLLQLSISAGFMLQPIIAYFIRDDVYYQLAALMPNCLFFFFIFVIPESLRWLAVAGKLSDADVVIRQICRVNKSCLPDNFDVKDFDDLQDESTGQRDCWSLLQTSNIRTRTIVVVFIWFTCSMMYYGLSLNTGALPGNIYVNTLISGAVEVPALLIGLLLMSWKNSGRRLTCCASFLVAGLSSLICIPLILHNYNIALTTLSMLGKSAITMTYCVIFVFASEIFPTEVRNVGMGLGSMAGGIGSMVAPYIGLPLSNIWSGFPFIVFGILATTAGLLSLLLPETFGRPLPDTIQQIEQQQQRRHDDDDIYNKNNDRTKKAKLTCAAKDESASNVSMDQSTATDSCVTTF